MTTPTIPDEAVTAALDVMLDNGNARLRAGGSGNRIYPPALEEDLRAALAAATPLLNADAWDEGYDAGRDDENYYERGVAREPDHPHTNPYRDAAEA